MAWLFIPQPSTSLSSPEEAGSLADFIARSQGYGPFVTSSGKPTQRPLSWRGWQKRSWIRRLSGMTLDPSTADAGVASWIASLAASPARTSATQASEPGSTASALGSGASSQGSSTRFALDLSQLKTSRRSKAGASIESSVTLPRSGSMRSGCVSEHPMSVPLTAASGSSSWLTPRATDGSNGGPNQRDSRGGLALPSQAAQWPTPRSSESENRTTKHAPSHGKGHGKTLAGEAVGREWPTPSSSSYGTNQGGAAGRSGPVRPSLDTLARLWPTTTTMDARASGAAAYPASETRNTGTTLTDAAVRQWATPTASEMDRGVCPSQLRRTTPGLQAEAMKWATPTSRDWKDGACADANVPTNSLLGRQVLRASGLQAPTTSKDGEQSSRPGRTLNPRFVEWLMGWPIGSSDCGYSETESSSCKPLPRTSSSTTASTNPALRRIAEQWGLE